MYYLEMFWGLLVLNVKSRMIYRQVYVVEYKFTK